MKKTGLNSVVCGPGGLAGNRYGAYQGGDVKDGGSIFRNREIQRDRSRTQEIGCQQG